MASISRREVAGKPRYDVNYREPDGRKRRKTFTRRVDADNFATTVESDKLRGLYLDRDAGRITFKKYADDYLANQTFEATTREQVALRLRLHVYPVLGSKMLAQIKPSTIQAWLAGLSGAPATKRVILANVSAILSAAVDDERIAKNPCKARSVTPPRKEDRKIVPWSLERVAAVREALPDQWRIALDLAVGLGLRQGEVFGLAPDDVDFLRGTVQVRRQVKVLAGNKLVFGKPKGHKVRTVPLPPAVRDLIAAHLANRPAQSVTLPWAELDGDLVTVRLILTTRERKALNRNYFNPNIWHKALAGAGVVRGNDEDGTGMHALRHHYASVLLDGGESIKAVSEYLGHSDPGFTLRVYTHLMPNSAERARRAVDAAFARYMGATSDPEIPAQHAAE